MTDTNKVTGAQLKAITKYYHLEDVGFLTKWSATELIGLIKDIEGGKLFRPFPINKVIDSDHLKKMTKEFNQVKYHGSIKGQGYYYVGVYDLLGLDRKAIKIHCKYETKIGYNLDRSGSITKYLDYDDFMNSVVTVLDTPRLIMKTVTSYKVATNMLERQMHLMQEHYKKKLEDMEDATNNTKEQ